MRRLGYNNRRRRCGVGRIKVDRLLLFALELDGGVGRYGEEEDRGAVLGGGDQSRCCDGDLHCGFSQEGDDVGAFKCSLDSLCLSQRNVARSPRGDAGNGYSS